jgi:predicted DNA-binding WGR domain protein
MKASTTIKLAQPEGNLMPNNTGTCDIGNWSWTRPETFTERAIREQAEKDYADALSDFNQSRDHITLPRKPETAAERLIREAARKAYQDAAREAGIFYFHKRGLIQ